VLAGNHDAYQPPFGISPRVKFDILPDRLEVNKGNQGIPADCNLTILEATLAFGKDYGKLIRKDMFTPDVLQLFHLLFNPLCSWTFPLGVHQMIVLDWGNEEGLLTNQTCFGHLPHASKAMSDEDLALVKYALELPKSQKAVLLSHYTWICYDYSVPMLEDLSDPERLDPGREHEFPVSGEAPTVTDYNFGTCWHHRDEMFELFETGKIAVSVSGHAHRPAVYFLKDNANVPWRTDSWTQGTFGRDTATDLTALGAALEKRIGCVGFYMEEAKKLLQGTAGHALKSFFDTNKLGFSKTIFVVSASAGPIPRENRGAFNGWGSTRASYTSLRFREDGSLESVQACETEARNSVPRLAVALDYMEWMGLAARDGTSIMKPQWHRGANWSDSTGNVFLEPWTHGSDLNLDIDATTASQSTDKTFRHEDFQFSSPLFSTFVSQPILILKDKDEQKTLQGTIDEILFFNNSNVEGFPTGVRAKSVSVYLWDGLERGLKECWLRLVYSGSGTWKLRKEDNLEVWAEFLATLDGTNSPSVWGKVKETFGGTYALESSAFLCFEFDGDLKGYDTASPWVVYGAWHQEQLSSGHLRITFFRNQIAHENPDHEIWRKAEYEAGTQVQNLPSSSATSNGGH
jgi:hypothetical protein